MNSVADILQKTSVSLQPMPTARLDVEILLSHCLGVDRTALFREPERTISTLQERTLRAMVAERKKGRPVAHLTGKTEFYSLELRVNESVLCPRADTELLVEQAINIAQDDSLRIIDVGTGSGAIAIALATHCPNTTVYAVELCEQALSIAVKNVEAHQLENLCLVRAEWLHAIAANSIDIVISNPPYIESDDPHLRNTDIQFEPKLALDGGVDGLSCYRNLLVDIPRVLKPTGQVLLEHGYQQGSKIRQMLEAAGLTSVKTSKDLAHHERLSSGVYQPPATLR